MASLPMHLVIGGEPISVDKTSETTSNTKRTTSNVDRIIEKVARGHFSPKKELKRLKKEERNSKKNYQSVVKACSVALTSEPVIVYDENKKCEANSDSDLSKMALNDKQLAENNKMEDKAKLHVEKCRRFLSNLLELSGEKAGKVRTLIQELIDAQLKPEEYCDGLEKLLDLKSQPSLLKFLKKHLGSLRQSLFSGEMVIEGIEPPPQRVLNMLSASVQLPQLQQNVENDSSNSLDENTSSPMETSPSQNNDSAISISSSDSKRSSISTASSASKRSPKSPPKTAASPSSTKAGIGTRSLSSPSKSPSSPSRCNNSVSKSPSKSPSSPSRSNNSIFKSPSASNASVVAISPSKGNELDAVTSSPKNLLADIKTEPNALSTDCTEDTKTEVSPKNNEDVGNLQVQIRALDRDNRTLAIGKPKRQVVIEQGEMLVQKKSIISGCVRKKRSRITRRYLNIQDANSPIREKLGRNVAGMLAEDVQKLIETNKKFKKRILKCRQNQKAFERKIALLRYFLRKKKQLAEKYRNDLEMTKNGRESRSVGIQSNIYHLMDRGNYTKSCGCVIHRCKIDDCDWMGKKDQLLRHVEKLHSDSLWRKDWEFAGCRKFDDDDCNDEFVKLLAIENQLFWMLSRYDYEQQRLYKSFQHIGMKEEAEKYYYQINIKAAEDRRKFLLKSLMDDDELKGRDSFESPNCAVIDFSILRAFSKNHSQNSITYCYSIIKA